MKSRLFGAVAVAVLLCGAARSSTPSDDTCKVSVSDGPAWLRTLTFANCSEYEYAATYDELFTKRTKDVKPQGVTAWGSPPLKLNHFRVVIDDPHDLMRKALERK